MLHLCEYNLFVHWYQLQPVVAERVFAIALIHMCESVAGSNCLAIVVSCFDSEFLVFAESVAFHSEPSDFISCQSTVTAECLSLGPEFTAFCSKSPRDSITCSRAVASEDQSISESKLGCVAK